MSGSILVSGGAGYIGSHICYALSKAGFTPVAVDDLSTGNAWAVGFGPFEQGDMGDADFVRAVCEKHTPVAAIHCAGLTGVEASYKNPHKYFETNRDKAALFFKTLNKCGVNQVVQIGTAAVYGDGGAGPIPEICAAVPISPYGQSNLEAEAYLRMLSVNGMRSVTLRCFNIAGAAPIEARIGEAHAQEEGLITRLVLALSDASAGLLQQVGLAGGFAAYGDDYPTPDGSPLRDYLHVCDLADIVLTALDHLMQGGRNEIFNIGSGQPVSVMEITSAARKIFNRPDFSPGFAPRRAGDVVQSVADITKITRQLGWQPKYELADIIRSAAAWHASPLYRGALTKKMAA